MRERERSLKGLQNTHRDIFKKTTEKAIARTRPRGRARDLSEICWGSI